jgi:hypothetical protein
MQSPSFVVTHRGALAVAPRWLKKAKWTSDSPIFALLLRLDVMLLTGDLCSRVAQRPHCEQSEKEFLRPVNLTVIGFVCLLVLFRNNTSCFACP